jgi:hypothetical protein
MEVLYQLSYPGGRQMLAGSRLSPRWEFDLLDDDSPVAETSHSDLAPILEAGFEERPLRDRHPSLLVDQSVSALAEHAVAIGRLDRRW